MSNSVKEDIAQRRTCGREKARTADLLRIVPRGRRSVLDIGARDGYFSKLLTDYFSEVTALDLNRPTFEFRGVKTVAGDVTRLDFADDSFDCVFCAEVLEHIPDLQRACNEIKRVARHEIVIGVPFRQDIRVGRTTCGSCGGVSPPWGHVNSFTEERLRKLFPGLRVAAKSFVESNKIATNPLSTFLMDCGGNPWGTYDQDESCGLCGAALAPPVKRSPGEWACAKLAAYINIAQSLFNRPHGNWIHLVFSKEPQ